MNIIKSFSYFVYVMYELCGKASGYAAAKQCLKQSRAEQEQSRGSLLLLSRLHVVSWHKQKQETQRE